MDNSEDNVKQLSLLSTFHYALGGAVGFVMSCFFITAAAGTLIGFAVFLIGDVFPDVHWTSHLFLTLLIIVVAALFAGLGWTLAICMFAVARNLKRKTRYRFCFVMACVECIIFMLFGIKFGGIQFDGDGIMMGGTLFMAAYTVIALCGTALGAFTIFTLRKESVKNVFRKSEAYEQTKG